MKIGIASADYLRADKNPDGTEAWGGSGWARVGQYIDYYRAAGHEVAAGMLWQRDGRFYIERADLSVLEPDIIIMQRMMHDGIAATIKTAKASGQIIINDLDDWYWGLDPSNLAFNASHPKNSPTENTNFYAQPRKVPRRRHSKLHRCQPLHTSAAVTWYSNLWVGWVHWSS
jgi:hypothetical protein